MAELLIKVTEEPIKQLQKLIIFQYWDLIVVFKLELNSSSPAVRYIPGG